MKGKGAYLFAFIVLKKDWTFWKRNIKRVIELSQQKMKANGKRKEEKKGVRKNLCVDVSEQAIAAAGSIAQVSSCLWCVVFLNASNAAPIPLPRQTYF